MGKLSFVEHPATKEVLQLVDDMHLRINGDKPDAPLPEHFNHLIDIANDPSLYDAIDHLLESCELYAVIKSHQGYIIGGVLARAARFAARQKHTELIALYTDREKARSYAKERGGIVW